MKLLIPIVLGVSVALGWVAFTRSADTSPQDRRMRYENLYIVIPGGVEAQAAVLPPVRPQDRPMIQVSLPSLSVREALPAEPPTLNLDAMTGEVISDTLSAANPTFARAILESRLVERDPPESIWPFDQAARQPAERRYRAIGYRMPDPESGIVTIVSKIFCPQDALQCRPNVIDFESPGASIRVDADTGQIISREGTGRWAEAIETIATTITFDPTYRWGDQ